MTRRNICSALCFALTLAAQSPTDAARVTHFSSTGAYGYGNVTIVDGCETTTFSVYGSESTIKGKGRAQAVPGASVNIYSWNSCTEDGTYLWGDSDSITFLHTPATHGSFPDTVGISGDVTLTDVETGTTSNVHVELQLARAGARYESVSSSHSEYPLENGTVKEDYNSRGHDSAATGSLNISGAFQLSTTSFNGFVGVSTLRTMTVFHQ